MSEKANGVGLDADATVSLLKHAIAFAKYSWPDAIYESTPYYVQGVLIAPHKDSSRPLMVVDLATEDQSEFRSAALSLPKPFDPIEPEGPTFVRQFLAATEQPTVF